MPQEIDENTLEKYLRVKALADRGVDGEKTTAQQTLKKMEEKYPHIRTKALLHAARKRMAEKEAQKQPAEEPQEKRATPRKPNGPTPKSGGFQDIFEYARFFYEAADSFVKTASEVQVGSRLAEQLRIGSGADRSGGISTSVVFSQQIYNQYTKLNDLQKKAFREKIHELLDAQFDSFLGKLE
jgi:hypothetical protein